MSGFVWDLSGIDKQCASYAPGHLIHWIHFNHSMREPSVVIPVIAALDDDGLVHIEGDDVPSQFLKGITADVVGPTQTWNQTAASFPPRQVTESPDLTQAIV